ncbi:F-box only protein 15 isoform X2 [Ailuropoda melanoleuca]|uniref:F-box only protein 15 isoform X2 n=1 Tax=Ailuropoda melanoleuca TaxID=9646 RepID=UPI001494DE6D|nr:F-box only protein 15 isoform X2 [Ailuropoda melanoleuca]
MATGRGRLLQQHWLGLQALRRPPGGVGAAPGTAWPAEFRKGLGAWCAGNTALRQCAGRGKCCELPSTRSPVSLESIPSEILLKIFSYLDAVTLLCTGCVNRHFYHLANDKISGLGWVIILKEKNGREYIMEHIDLSINDSSVTIMWYGKTWPQLATLSTLDLCGVTPLFMDRSKTPSKNGPRWHSLIAKYNLSNLTESTMIGWDRLIRIFCLHPGLLVGLWKGEEELAFVMANLHFHHLVEKSTLGSATVPYELPPHTPLLDDSPEYGLHGYQLHVDMHSSGIFCLCGTFRNLFTKKGSIENGYVKLVVISFKNNTEHLPLIGKVGLSWRTDIFDGCIKSCSIMDVTLLDEYGKPFWCFSSPVCMRSSGPSDGPNFLGQTYYVDYVDSEGRVHVELVWIKETEEYFIVSLVLYLRVAKINHWFGTTY